MKAWVITYLEPDPSGNGKPEAVIGILPSRTPSEKVKDHLEWLVVVFSCSANEMLAFVKQRSAFRPFEPQYYGLNKLSMHCGSDHVLFARLAENISVLEEGQKLEWTEPKILMPNQNNIFDPKRIPGKRKSAKVLLPLKLALPSE